MTDALKLLRVLVAAERLRLRLLLRRHATRGMLLLGGLMFLAAALGMLHVLGFLALARHLDPIEASLVVLAVDLVAGLAMVVGAVRLQPGRAERDARAVREGARTALTRQTQLMRLAVALLALLRR